ncbi:MAG: hypothetical protein B7X28_09080 [Halothiobacillus sp. 13-55-253]|nr:MAG: hypothetical protein B7X28_09080 [Halothiobacillus sp. 13-55-253]
MVHGGTFDLIKDAMKEQFTGASFLKNFEQPLNERIRACLRLEYLFDRFDQHLADETAEGSLCAMLILIEATDVLGRIDVKQRTRRRSMPKC